MSVHQYIPRYWVVAILALIAVLGITLVFSLESEDSDADSISFTNGSVTYTVTSESDLEVEVTKVAETSLTSLTLPDTVSYSGSTYKVTSIGASAVSNNSVLVSINIPQYVEKIGKSAFSGCSKITSITIPQKVTSIGEQAFYDCTSLVNIQYNALEVADDTTSTRFSLGYYSTLSGDRVVTVGDGVKNIPIAMFASAKVSSVTLPASLKTIGKEAFEGCYISSIVIPAAVSCIGEQAFYDCTKLIDIQYNATNVTDNGSTAIFTLNSLHSLSGSRTLTVGEGVESIPSYMFNSARVSVLSLPSTLASIGKNAFYSCYFTSLTIPKNVTYIGTQAFYDCTNLASVTVNAVSLQDMSDSDLLFSINSLHSTPSRAVVFGEGATHVPAYMFRSGHVASVELASTVSSIGEYAFEYNSSLTSFTAYGVIDELGTGCFTMGDTASYGGYSVTCEVQSIMPSGWGDEYTNARTTLNYTDIAHVELNLSGKTLKSIPSDWQILDGKLLKYYPVGASITIPELSVEGYTFTGWDSTPAATMGTVTLVYTSSWLINTVTITFDTAGGTVIDSITAVYGTKLSVNDPVKTGYDFTGWSPSMPATMPESNLTITAGWTLQKHTVTYVFNNGTEDKTVELYYGEVIVLPAVTRTGYDFVKWSVDEGTTMGESDITVTAIWQIRTVTIAFDTQGGTSIDSITAAYGTDIPEVSTTLTGYDFAGWSPSLPSTMPEYNQTYVASWTIQKHTVHYDTGCSIVLDDKVLEYGTVIDLPSISRDGYSFVSWSVPAGTTMGESDITITASWAAKEVTVTFDTDGAGEILPITGNVDSEFSVESPSKHGYTFKGWNPELPNVLPTADTTYVAVWALNYHTVTYVTNCPTSISAVSVGYNEEIPLPSLSWAGHTFDSWSVAEGTLMDDEDVEVTASWTTDTVTVTFNTNGGTVISPITGLVGSSLHVANPTKTGYIFTNWSPALPSTMPAEDTVYTASWTVNHYKVTFKISDNSVLTSYYVDYGQKIGEPSSTPTRAGYDFIGWSVSADTKMGASDLTVNAIWEGKAYRVYYLDENALPVFLRDYRCGELISEIKPPTLKGYEFQGWKDAPETMPANDLFLDPIWYPAEEEDNTMLYVGIGAVAVFAALGAGAFLFIRHKH